MKILFGHGLGSLKKQSDKNRQNMEFRDGLLYKNVLATYIHIHAEGVKVWAKNFVSTARRFNEGLKVKDIEIRID